MFPPASTRGSLLIQMSQRARVAQSSALLNYDRSNRVSVATLAVFFKTNTLGGHGSSDMAAGGGVFGRSVMFNCRAPTAVMASNNVGERVVTETDTPVVRHV